MSTGYSTTNIQVAGVDEPDTVKNDGEYIYTVSGNTVFIVNASLPDAGVVSRIECDDFAPAGIFVSGDRLAILGSNYSMPLLMPYSQSQVVQAQTYVRLYDVSDRANPSLLRNFTMTGNYLDSRMIGKYVYFVTSMPSYLLNDTVILPTIILKRGRQGNPGHGNLLLERLRRLLVIHDVRCHEHSRRFRRAHNHVDHDGPSQQHVRLPQQHIRDLPRHS